MDAESFSGGAWILFDKGKTNVSFVDSNSQSVSVKISLQEQTWLLSAICASPTNSLRSSLWNYLANIGIGSQLPWLIIGDFNEL